MLRKFSMVISIFVLTVLLLSITVVPVMAFDGRTGNTVTIGSSETVNGDLYLAGSDIIIDGTVNGDVYAAGRSININGTINGAITLAAQTLVVNGTISRSARIFGQNINFNGSIKGDVVAFGSYLVVGSNSKIGGDLVIGSTSSTIQGTIDGNVKGGSSTCTIGAKIGKDVEISAEELSIESTAQIQGNFTYTSTKEAKINSGAKITGKKTQNLPVAEEADKKGFVGEIPGKILELVMAFIAGLILIFVATRRTKSTAMAITTKPWLCLGWGALLLFVAPLAIIIICITLIGLPVGLIALALWFIALYLSQIPVALCIGKLILSRKQEISSKGIMLGALAIGLAILIILRWIPFLGFFIGLATVLFGMGSIIVSEMNLRKGV